MAGSTTPPLAAAPPRTLITGGAGFIGSHLAELLLARGDLLTVVDDLSTGRRSNLPAAHDRLRFVHADLAAYLADAKNDPDHRFDEIYHLAAAVGVKLVMDEPVRSIEVNVGQTAALLNFACTAAPGGGPARTLIASSSEVYGKSDRMPFREDDDVVYGPTTKGRWSYAASKAIDEYLALAHHAKHGLPVVVARFFNTVGPRQIGAYGMVLPNFVAAAKNGQELPVHGDGTQSRCFCDVRDVVQVLPQLLGNPECAGQVFNVGSDRVITIRDLADLVIKTLGSPSRVRLIPYDQVYSAGFEDLAQRRPDLDRLTRATGFVPRRTLEQTIQDVAASLP